MGKAAEKYFINRDLAKWAIAETHMPESFFILKREYVSELLQTGSATFCDLKDFSNMTHVPFGYLFLKTPPAENAYSPEFRTIKNARIETMSQNLKQTVIDMEYRKDWMSEYRKANGADPISLSGRITMEMTVFSAAEALRKTLGINKLWFKEAPDKDRVFSLIREKAEKAGILVMMNGVVGEDGTRRLDINEFRGFALPDDFSPLVFVNSQDEQASAKTFTVLHEITHLLLERKADLLFDGESDTKMERLINGIVAEVTMPTDEVMSLSKGNPGDISLAYKAAGYFRTSLLATAIRLYRAEIVGSDVVAAAKKISESYSKKKTGGGDYYRTSGSRLSSAFSRAVIESVQSQTITYTDGFRLLWKNGKTFDAFGRYLSHVKAGK